MTAYRKGYMAHCPDCDTFFIRACGDTPPEAYTNWVNHYAHKKHPKGHIIPVRVRIDATGEEGKTTP